MKSLPSVFAIAAASLLLGSAPEAEARGTSVSVSSARVSVSAARPAAMTAARSNITSAARVSGAARSGLSSANRSMVTTRTARTALSAKSAALSAGAKPNAQTAKTALSGATSGHLGGTVPPAMGGGGNGRGNLPPHSDNTGGGGNYKGPQGNYSYRGANFAPNHYTAGTSGSSDFWFWYMIISSFHPLASASLPPLNSALQGRNGGEPIPADEVKDELFLEDLAKADRADYQPYFFTCQPSGETEGAAAYLNRCRTTYAPAAKSTC